MALEVDYELAVEVDLGELLVAVFHQIQIERLVGVVLLVAAAELEGLMSVVVLV
jgi:hypothetical protein